VIHYTAGRSAASSVQWLSNPAARASAHVVVGRDGGITQLVPFDRIAWHAGRSSWKGDMGLNQLSLGIELDNPGRLERVGGRWRAWFQEEFDESEVIEAVHKHETRLSGWHSFTPEQIEAAVELSNLLVNKYDLRDVVGHDDISPGRKSDPGPAFPMSSFRARVLGRSEDEEEVFETTTALNIRTGPGAEHETLEGSPLPQGTRVAVLREDGSWRFVDVLDAVGDVIDLEGWVHGRFLRLSA
jgi:N-acetylmuramoyl-L-alanine amidase